MRVGRKLVKTRGLIIGYIRYRFGTIAPHRRFRRNIRVSLSSRLPALEFCSRRRQQVTSTRRSSTRRVDHGDDRVCVSALSFLACFSLSLSLSLSPILAALHTPSLSPVHSFASLLIRFGIPFSRRLSGKVRAVLGLEQGGDMDS